VRPTYLAGYDGHDPGRAAVRFARRLGEALDSRVVAVHVYEHVPFIPAKGASEGARRELEEDAREAAERLLAELDEPGVETLAVHAESVAQGLQEVAEHERASLLAVGLKERGALARLVMGRVAERLLHGAPCPVAAVPVAVPDALTTIAVAYDGRREARAALEAVVPTAVRLKAKLLLLGAIEPDTVPAIALIGAVTDLDERLREEMQARLDEGAALLPANVEVETQVVPGVGGPAIVVACRQHGADLLVSGSRGYGPVRSVMLGSMSRYLVDHAPCPVVVMARGAAVRLDRAPAEPAVAGV
jgi:nucleotide-binding universal stress UspA family protein